MKRRNDYLEVMPNGPADRGRQFANLIRDTRLAKGMTQDELVAESGVSKSTIVRWEGGRAERPDPDQVRAMCIVLGIDPRQAAVALGYLTPEDLGPPDSAARQLDPAILEVIEALEDPRVPSAQKEQWVLYLRYLREQSGQSRRTAG